MSTATVQPARGRRPNRVGGIGLSPRLFAAMGLIVLAGAATLLVAALLAAPPVFRSHLRMALGDIPAEAQRHVDEAFTRATLLSLGTAVVVATLAALAVTWLVSRRIAVPVADLAAAARQLAAGGYDIRVPDPGLGPEFGALADSFNTMARRLAATERVRQRMLADLAHELLQFRCPGRGEHFLRNAFLMHLAVVHEDELGADVTGEAHFMRDQNQRHPFAGQLLDHAQHLINQFRVERRGDFIA